MNLSDAFEARRSIRSYSSAPVPREVLDRVFWAASRAPSSMNEQPWRFYVAQNEARMAVGEVMAQSTGYLEEYMKVIGHEVDGRGPALVQRAGWSSCSRGVYDATRRR